MPSLITLEDLSLNPLEAAELSEAILEQVFVQGDLAEMHDISTGIQFNKQIPFISNVGESGKVSADCVPPEADGVTVTQKLWLPKIIEARFIHCQKDLNALFKLAQRVRRINPEFFDKINSPVFEVLSAKIIDSLKRSIFRLAWFGDTAADVTANGGVFLAGTDLGLFTPIDGFWKQIFAEVTGAKRITITQNAAVSFAAQLAITPTEAKQYIDAVYKAADARLKANPDAAFYVTETIYEAYAQWIRDEAAGNGGLTQVVVDGVQRVAYNGRPVMPIYEWDRYIQTYQQNGVVYNLPHRILFTMPMNLAIGTVAESDLETLDSFYDKTLKSNIVDYAYSLDAKFLEDYLAVVAY